MPHDFRYDQFNDAPNFTRVVGERHLIPLFSPYLVKLNEVPEKGDPSNMIVKEIELGTEVTVIDTFTEVNATPAQGEFRPDYGTGADGDETWNTGAIQFSAADAGKLVSIDYTGTGTLASVKAPRNLDWMYDYGNGTAGDIVATNGQVLSGIIECNSLYVPEGVTAYVGNNNTLPTIIKSRGSVVINGTLSGLGRAGISSNGYGTGGGGGGYTFSGAGSAGGTPSLIDGVAYIGQGQSMDINAIKHLSSKGFAGCGAASGGVTPDGGGYMQTRGGAGLLIVAPSIKLTGSINLNGANGYGGVVGSWYICLGGGGGGCCIIAAKTISITGEIHVAGGSPGSAGGYSGTAGGAGWFYSFELGVE